MSNSSVLEEKQNTDVTYKMLHICGIIEMDIGNKGLDTLFKIFIDIREQLIPRKKLNLVVTSTDESCIPWIRKAVELVLRDEENIKVNIHIRKEEGKESKNGRSKKGKKE